jgi:hypothetical protein
LLARLLDSVKRTYTLLERDDMDAFDREMDRCGETMARVDELEVSVENLKGRIPDVQQQPDIVRLEREIRYIAQQIEQARRECNDLAQQKLGGYSQQIKGIRHTKKGIDGYASQLQRRDAFFIDAKK